MLFSPREKGVATIDFGFTLTIMVLLAMLLLAISQPLFIWFGNFIRP